jgi:hypothetical protein
MLVESAIVFIPTFAMMLGILDFSVAIFLRSTFQHACREGVRYAVTYQVVPGLGHDASIKSVVKNHSMGFLNGAAGDSKIKIRYYTPDTFTETLENAPGNIIEVSVEGFQWGWILPLMRQGSPFQMTARATDRMEGLPGGSAAPPR